VLLVLFSDLLTSPDAKHPSATVPVQAFYERLVKLQVRKKDNNVPNLTSFLAFKKSTSLISVLSLTIGCSEFIGSDYFKSFGVSKR